MATLLTALLYGKIVFMFQYISEVRGELAKVTWPTREEVIRLTAVVIAISILVGVYIGALDFIFAKLLEYLVQ